MEDGNGTLRDASSITPNALYNRHAILVVGTFSFILSLVFFNTTISIIGPLGPLLIIVSMLCYSVLVGDIISYYVMLAITHLKPSFNKHRGYVILTFIVLTYVCLVYVVFLYLDGEQWAERGVEFILYGLLTFTAIGITPIVSPSITEHLHKKDSSDNEKHKKDSSDNEKLN